MKYHSSTTLGNQLTNVADPWTAHGYSQWHNAENVRREWMRMMGLSEDEITESINDDPPIDLDDEIAEYNAMFRIQRLNETRDG